jgi:DNA-binding SARP family transcriptional activator
LKAAFDLAYASLTLAALLTELNDAEATGVWFSTSKEIVAADLAFLLERERAIAFPLVAKHLNDHSQELASVCGSLLSHLERVPPPPLLIRTLGSFSVTQRYRQISEDVWRQRRAGELFRLLLITPGRTLLRDQIVDALWPEKAPGTTQALLHQATSMLRRALEPDLPGRFPSRYVVFDEGRVTLRLPPGSDVDFERFEEHVRNEDWEAAVACYEGELYPDDRYASWAAEHGERLSQLAVKAFVNAAIHRHGAGNPEAALEACQKALVREPWHELATLTAMKACMALNDRARALRLYQELDRRLREELETEPETHVQEYYRAIL